MEIVIPVAAFVGILFSLVQWFLVSLVKDTPDRNAPPSGPNGNKNGYNDYLIEEKEGLNDQNVVVMCAEIQNAISEGSTSFLFTMHQYVGVFMVVFAILIFLFLGSVEGFSAKSQPCTRVLPHLNPITITPTHARVHQHSSSSFTEVHNHHYMQVEVDFESFGWLFKLIASRSKLKGTRGW